MRTAEDRDRAVREALSKHKPPSAEELRAFRERLGLEEPQVEQEKAA